MSSSNAMFFTDENTVVMAWLLNVEQGGTKAFQNQDGTRVEGRLRIGSYSIAEQRFTDSSDNKGWIRDQKFHFGQAGAIAYHSGNQNNRNIYVGGACDFEGYYSGQLSNWVVCVYQVETDGNIYMSNWWKIDGVAYSAHSHPYIN